MFIFERETERELACVSWGGAERERERERDPKDPGDPQQAPC